MWRRIGLVLGVSAALTLGGRENAAPGSMRADAQVGQAAADALAAAMRIFDGISGPECRTPNPEGKACITPRSSEDEAARGVAVFGVAGADGIGGTNAILGRGPDGEWRVWFTTQNFYYPLLYLPGEMMVCAEGGDLNIRAGPSLDAAVVAVLPHLTRVTAEELVLAEEQVVFAESGRARSGAGWYRLSAPVEGWASSRLLSNTFVDAAMGRPDCWARDLREADEP